MIIFDNASLDLITPIGQKISRLNFSCNASYSSSSICFLLDKNSAELLARALSTWVNRIKVDESKITPEHGGNPIKNAEALRDLILHDLSKSNLGSIEQGIYRNFFYCNMWQLDVHEEYKVNIHEETDPIISEYCNEFGIKYHIVNALKYWLDECTYNGIAEALLEYTDTADNEEERLKAIDLLILLNKSLSLYRSDYNYESLSLIMAQLCDGNISVEKFIGLALPFIEGLDVNKWGPRSIEHMRRAASSITESTKKKGLKDIESIYYYLEE